MTKREEWDEIIKKVENDDYTTNDILQFLRSHRPKSYESKKKLPCVCGSKDVAAWWNMKTSCWFFRCRDCNRQSLEAKHVNQAKANWNEMVEKECMNNGSED